MRWSAFLYTACGTWSAIAFAHQGPKPEDCAAALETRQITVWRYAGHADFKSASIATIQPNDAGHFRTTLLGEGSLSGVFKPSGRALLSALQTPIAIDPLATELGAAPETPTSLLDLNQTYPLQVMSRAAYLTAQMAEHQRELARGLQPAQVTFIEVTDRFSESDLRARKGVLPDQARQDAIEKGIEDYLGTLALPEAEAPVEKHYDLKVGSAWLISGQTPAGKAALPLEAGLTLPIDRARYPFIWEIGRATQESPEAFKDALKIATSVALQELAVLGGSLDDAYIFGHALDRVHAALYRRSYEMKDHSGYSQNAEERALVIPLRALLARFKPRWTSPAREDMHRFFPGAPSEAMLALLLQRLRGQVNSALPLESGAIARVRDFSPVVRALTRTGGRLLPLDFLTSLAVRTERDWARTLTETGPYHVSRTGSALNSPHETLDEFLKAHRAIEISLPPGESVESAHRALEAAYSTVIQTLREDAGMESPEEWLAETNVRFALTTTSRSVFAQLPRGLGDWTVASPQEWIPSPTPFGRTRIMTRPEFFVGSLILAPETIAAWKPSDSPGELRSRRERSARQRSFADLELLLP